MFTYQTLKYQMEQVKFCSKLTFECVENKKDLVCLLFLNNESTIRNKRNYISQLGQLIGDKLSFDNKKITRHKLNILKF